MGRFLQRDVSQRLTLFRWMYFSKHGATDGELTVPRLQSQTLRRERAGDRSRLEAARDDFDEL
jgi:hypothetical protein